MRQCKGDEMIGVSTSMSMNMNMEDPNPKSCPGRSKDVIHNLNTTHLGSGWQWVPPQGTFGIGLL